MKKWVVLSMVLVALLVDGSLGDAAPPEKTFMEGLHKY